MAETKKNSAGSEKPAESSGKSANKRTLAKVTRLFWVALAILIFLLIFSITILSTRMYKYVKLVDQGRVVEITADGLEEFKIFLPAYTNEKGENVVQSSNGDAVIAPNTSNSYTIVIKNNDKIALDYSFDPDVVCEGVETLPLKVRLFKVDPYEGYILGDNDTWVSLDEFKEWSSDVSTIAKGAMDTYEFQWRWVTNSDEEDTFLGTLSGDDAPKLSLSMGFDATVNTSESVNGGIFGLGMDDMLWWLIFVILLLIAIVLLVLSLIARKEKELEPTVVYAPAPTPAPEPVPVIVPTSTPKKKQKGFVGKMAYVNIDTLVDIFNNGDTITLKILKEKGLVDEKATQVKILARNDMELNKAFHIETQGISGQARHKVIAAGGTIKIIDG